MSGLASKSATDCNPSQTLIVAQAPHIIRLKYKKRPHVDVDIDVDVDALLVYDDEDACRSWVVGVGSNRASRLVSRTPFRFGRGINSAGCHEDRGDGDDVDVGGVDEAGHHDVGGSDHHDLL